MASAKDIVLKPIARSSADRIIKAHHYSGKVVQNSQLHFGVFLDDRLEGALSFGPSLDKRRMMGLVRDTRWNGFIELNRMAFSDRLPKNSESRAIGVALRTIRRAYPHIEWVVSFADGTQCGTGTIYRAAGFVLTGMTQGSLWELPPDLAKINGGNVTHRMKVQDKTSTLSRHILAKTGGKNLTMAQCAEQFGGRVLPGYQFRYLYFLNPEARQRLTVPVIPFDQIPAREMAGGPVPPDPGRIETDPRAPNSPEPPPETQ